MLGSQKAPLSTESKLYVQLQPDAPTMQWLLNAQNQLTNAMRVPENQLHMTIIHFGKISKMIDSIRYHADTSEPNLLAEAQCLADRWRIRLQSIEEATIFMKPARSSLFGVHENNYVVEFEVPEYVLQLHRDCLSDLHVFFRSIGIDNPEQFMQQDANFQHALGLRPHVTLAKQYTGIVYPLHTPPTSASFHCMRVIY